MKSLNGTGKFIVAEKKKARSSLKKFALDFFAKPVFRLINILLSATILILSFPLTLLIALIIKMDSPGPAIFRQTRIGYNRRGKNARKKNSQHGTDNSFIAGKGNRRAEDLGGRPFKFYKFRTMKENAKELYPELYAYDYTEEEINKMNFKLTEDPRLTKCGRWLRQTSLDELPNFINVLKGNMNLVGPRPDIPEMIKYYNDEQKTKLDVKPGITGFAQINGRGRLRFQDTLKFDVEYVKTHSLLVDIKTIFKTIWAIITKRGAF